MIGWTREFSPCHRTITITIMQTRKSNSPTGSEGSSRTRCIWTFEDNSVLLDAILVKKVDSGISPSSFRDTLFTDVIAKVNAVRTKGGEKNLTSVKARYTKVCISFVRVLPVS
jgi:hypothetical protein